MDGNRIILAAHRGDRKLFPENTIPAFKSALQLNVDMIETDVHMTKDKYLIIIHDRSLLRTTGVDLFTDQTTLEEIKSLDAGLWFSKEFKGTKVPTAQEFIELIKDTNVMINWELKDYPCDVGDEFAFETVDKLIDLIEKNGLTKRSMINSFSDKVLEYVYKTYGGNYPIHGQGILNCQKTKDKANIEQEKLYNWCCLYPNETGFSPLDFPENFEYCTRNKIIPCVCVADEIETYKKYIELGCRMFTSNDIYMADKILKELNVRK